jgi:L-ascorbate metabolism protein UlaG (beta-lactamase superfamily)
MRITWYGHACFRLDAGGLAIVTDPYTPDDAGLEPVEEPADVVVMSSALDTAHSYWQMVPGDPRVINAVEVIHTGAELGPGATLWAVPTMEGDGADRPDEPKANAMYGIEADGLRICHMGDTGNPLTAEQLEPFRGRVDVLLALAGANLTIALSDLDDVIDALQPRIVVPMHHWSPSLNYRVGRVEDFLERRARDRVVHASGSELDVSAGDLPAETTIVVLQPRQDPLAAASA